MQLRESAARLCGGLDPAYLSTESSACVVDSFLARVEDSSTSDSVLKSARRCIVWRWRMCKCLKATAALAVVLLLSPAARAQESTATIGGVVKDASGAVLPGVTVEAASPELIEKVRTVVTDGQGRYQIIDLRPGLYSVTFTLTGFNTIKRDGINLPADFTANVGAQLQVGSLQETVTVSG